MLKTITPYFIIVGCAMHIFCCGLPLLLSITSLTNVFGVSSLSVFEIEWFEAVEDYVLILSGMLLFVTYLINRLSKKLDCSKDDFCTHPPCIEKKNISSYMFKIAVILYLLNIMTFLINTFII